MAPRGGTRAKRWVFTLNNYTESEISALTSLGESDEIEYLIFGKEVGESGTPHLQGFVYFATRKTFNTCRAAVGIRAHIEVARGSLQQAAEYCKKEGDFQEFGECPGVTQGKRSDWERLREHVNDLEERPTRRSLFTLFPGLMARYEHAVWTFIDSVLPEVTLTDSEPHDGWQRELADRIAGPANDRTIEFIYDPLGGAGKTWFCQWAFSTMREEVQILRIGKRDDLAHSINPDCRIFLIDVPRSQMEFLQYSVLESLKDRMVFSPKYHSQTKILRHKCHVIVFCNESPNTTQLTSDRYVITQLSHTTIPG